MVGVFCQIADQIMNYIYHNNTIILPCVPIVIPSTVLGDHTFYSYLKINCSVFAFLHIVEL